MLRFNSLKTLIFLICILFAACKSQKITYSKDYTMEMDLKPTRLASLDPSGQYLFGAEAKSKSGMGTPEAMLIDLKNQKKVWGDKMNKLGDIESDPDNIQWFWDEKKVLFFSRNFDFKLSCVDMMTGNEIWSFSDKKNRYSQRALRFEEDNLIMLSTPKGLAAYDLEDGKQVWLREDLQVKSDFADFVTGSASSVNYHYFAEKNRLLLSVNENIHWINPANGESEWTVTERIGSVSNADIFDNKDIAIFYGATDESFGESILESSELVDFAKDIAESGLIKEDLIGLDLNSGEVIYRKKFITNGSHRVMVKDDYLIVLGLVLNVFDFNSGDLKWQSIEEKRFDSNNIFKALAGLTGIDLTVKDKANTEDLIKDNHIYALYPLALENATKQNKFALRQYDLESGEVIWSTEIEKMNIINYFGSEGVLVIEGTTNGFVERPYLLGFDAGSGELLYDIKVNTPTGSIDILAAKGRLYFNRSYSADFFIWDLRTGEEVPYKLPANRPLDLRMLQGGLLVAYERPTTLALHDPKDFSVLKQTEIPGYFSDFNYVGDKFFMKDLEGDPPGGLITMDLEQFKVTGYLLNSQKGSASFQSGNDSGNLIYKDYYLFLSGAGDAVIQIDKDDLTRFVLD